MLTSLHRALTRLWLRKFRKKQIVPSVRAVFLGDTVSTYITLDGLYEKYELDVLEAEVFSQLDPASTCLDIGANIGNHTNFFAKHFKRVISFEPNPMVHAVLVANTIGSNVTTVQKGLSDSAKALPFEEDFANLGASHVVAEGEKAASSIEVCALDDLTDEYAISDVSFIKIDVENHEYEAFQGAANFLQTHKPVIAMEAFFSGQVEHGKMIEELLKSYGYKHFYRLVPQSDFIRRLENTPLTPKKGLMRVVLPKKLRMAQKLEETTDVAGFDHQLLVISEQQLLS